MPECYIRGSTIKYLRIPDEVIDMVKEDAQVKSRNRAEMKPRGGVGGGGQNQRGRSGGRNTFANRGGGAGRASSQGNRPLAQGNKIKWFACSDPPVWMACKVLNSILSKFWFNVIELSMLFRVFNKIFQAEVCFCIRGTADPANVSLCLRLTSKLLWRLCGLEARIFKKAGIPPYKARLDDRTGTSRKTDCK